MYKVKDNVDLIRDPHTGAILNTNLLDQVSMIKDEISEIKSLLKELLNGSR